MPGRLFLTRPISQVADALNVPLDPVKSEKPRQNIAPNETIAVLTTNGLSMMRWGIIPVGRVNARGRPVMETIINARSETVFDKSAFSGVGRGVVPVDGWYEWTGEKQRKIAWEISLESQSLLYFAAITDVWTAPGGLTLPQVATVTCPPNRDVQKIHHRMGVILGQEDIPVWLDGSDEDAAQLMTPLQNGLLKICRADPSIFK